MATRVRHDAETAVLVAAFDDGHPRADTVGAPRQTERKRNVVVRAEIDLRAPLGLRLRNQHRQHARAASANYNVHLRRTLEQRRAFLLGDAPGNGNERFAHGLFREDAEFAETRVELLLCVLADAARVDDNDIGLAIIVRTVVPCGFKQSSHLLGVVVVHLTTVRLDQVLPAHPRPLARRLSLSPFAFPSSFALPRSASISAALARIPLLAASPAIMRASSVSRAAVSSLA